MTEQPAVTEFDGLLLMGGTDVNAALYGQESHSQEDDAPDDERDKRWSGG